MSKEGVLFMDFKIGKEYFCILNGQKIKFRVFSGPDDEGFFEILWDDGDVEYAHPEDMERWFNDFENE